MIDIKIKVKNDNASYTKEYDRDCFYFSVDSPEFLDLVTECINEFGQEVNEVIFKASLRYNPSPLPPSSFQDLEQETSD